MQTTLGSDDLLVVLALCREKTLERAAAWLERDPSSVFRAINRIEKRFGATLFERSRDGFHASDEAQSLAEIGARISDALAAAQAVTTLAGSAKGRRLIVTTTDLLLETCILPNLGAFQSRHPDVSLEFSTQNTFENIWERGVDMAIRPSNEPPGHLIGRCLSTFEYRLVCGPKYEAFEQWSGDLSDLDWLVPGGTLLGHPVRRWFDQTVVSPRSVVGLGSFSAVVSAVNAGLGVAVLPCLPGLLDGLTTIEATTRPDDIEVWCLYHQSKRQDVLISHFAEFVRKSVRAPQVER